MYNYRNFLDFSENYIQIVESENYNNTKKGSMLISSVLFSWIAIECFVNSMLDDFASLPEDMFALHERAFLLEKKLKFQDCGDNLGKFILDNQSEYRRLEDKIFFLIAKFGKEGKNYKGENLWQKFEQFKETRNNIMHPRIDKEIDVNIDMANCYFETAKNIIGFISKHVWGKSVDI